MTEFSSLKILDTINEYFRESTYLLYEADEDMYRLGESISHITGIKSHKLPLFIVDNLVPLMENFTDDGNTYKEIIFNTIRLVEAHLKDRRDDQTLRQFNKKIKEAVLNTNDKNYQVVSFENSVKKLLQYMGHPPYVKPKGIIDLTIGIATAGRKKEQLDAIDSLYHMLENAEDYIQDTQRSKKFELATIGNFKKELRKLPIKNKENRINTFIDVLKDELY